MADEPDQEALEKLCGIVHSDLAERMNEIDGTLLVKYVALVEVVMPDGERGMYTLTSNDIKTWETIGMLEYAKQLEQAGLVADEQGDE